MNIQTLANVIESILFLAGKEVETSEISEKLSVSKKDIKDAVDILKQKYSGDCGIVLLSFNDKLQFSSNSKYADDVSIVLNPIREKELTKAMLETLAIIAYKQPLTRLDVEEIRGVDCTYALQNLSKLNMIRIIGRKDAIGKPLLFGTTDEFLKRFGLSNLEALPNYEELIERIQSLETPTKSTQQDFYNSNRDKSFDIDEQLPNFLKGEEVVVID